MNTVFEKLYQENELYEVVYGVMNVLHQIFSDKRLVFMGLRGELGAGKTTLTKKLLKTYGVEKSVVSPTFVLRRDYEAMDNLKIIHIDAYRLEKKDDIFTILKDVVTKKETGEVVFVNQNEKYKTLIIIEWPEMTSVTFDVIFDISHVDEDVRSIKTILL